MKKSKEGIDYIPHRVYSIGEPRAQGFLKIE